MRVVLSGGGTGGHIYPALAVAEQLRREDANVSILYIGSERGLEKELVAKIGLPFEAIHITGFKRQLSWDNVKTVFRFIRGVRKAKRILKSFRPDVVVGTGGYVCGPVVYAAARTGIPTIIHEQNAIPGLTNKFLSRYADCVAVSFSEGQSQFPKARSVVYTGNPRATEAVKADPMAGWIGLGLAAGSPLVIVVGGSRGALSINQAMIGMAPYISQLSHIYFIYVTGQPYYENTLQQLNGQFPQLPGNLRVVPYVHNMPEVLAATKLVIGRAGASSLAEITALGIPSILIPSPNVTNNHQEANASQLERAGAAAMLLERDLSGQTLYDLIAKILRDPIRWEHMSLQAKLLGMPDAAERFVNEMKRICRKQK